MTVNPLQQKLFAKIIYHSTVMARGLPTFFKSNLKKIIIDLKICFFWSSKLALHLIFVCFFLG